MTISSFSGLVQGLWRGKALAAGDQDHSCNPIVRRVPQWALFPHLAAEALVIIVLQSMEYHPARAGCEASQGRMTGSRTKLTCSERRAILRWWRVNAKLVFDSRCAIFGLRLLNASAKLKVYLITLLSWPVFESLEVDAGRREDGGDVDQHYFDQRQRLLNHHHNLYPVANSFSPTYIHLGHREFDRNSRDASSS